MALNGSTERHDRSQPYCQHCECLTALASPAGFVSAVCIAFGSCFICTSFGSDAAVQLCVQSCNFDLLPCCTFISDKTIWVSHAISVSHSLNILYACVRQFTAPGQTALSYLELLYDKAGTDCYTGLQTLLVKDKTADILCFSYCQPVSSRLKPRFNGKIPLCVSKAYSFVLSSTSGVY